MTYQNRDNIGCGTAIIGYCTAVALAAVLGPLAVGGIAFLRTKNNPEIKIESYDIGAGHAKIKFAKNIPSSHETDLESKVETSEVISNFQDRIYSLYSTEDSYPICEQ